VLKNDIMLEASRKHLGTRLEALERNLMVLPEVATLILAFEQFLSEHEHIAMVVNEYGGVEGVVTLEDVVETLLGIEIVDETDVTIDMQAMARQRWSQRARSMGLIPSESESASQEGGPDGITCIGKEIGG